MSDNFPFVHGYAGIIPCAYCKVGIDERCRTANGHPREQAHQRRWMDANYKLGGSSYPGEDKIRMKLLEDDPRFGLSEGDILICQDYRYDAKFTVLYRESDHYNPECNQYSRALEFMAWVPASEVWNG